MSTIIIITPPKRENRSSEESDETTIKVKVDGDGSVADQLRAAADILDGSA